jgi:hypothetical protein
MQSEQFDVLHEPFTDCYYFGEDRQSNRYGDAPEKKEISGASVCRQILEPGGKRRFVKELCFQADPYLGDDFIRRVISAFIVRSPDAVFSSLIKLKPDFTEHEFGYTALERIWGKVSALQDKLPLLIDGDEFRAAPSRSLAAFCAMAGIAHDAKMLSWSDGRIRPWGPDEAESQAKWHNTLELSNGIIPPSPREEVPVPEERRELMCNAWRVYRDIMSARAQASRRPTGSRWQM